MQEIDVLYVKCFTFLLILFLFFVLFTINQPII